MPCQSSGGGAPVNQQALDDLTCQFAGDFLAWLEVQFDYTFDGIINVQPNGYVDEIEFDCTGDIALTRIRSAPWNGWPHELGHDDPDCPAGPAGSLFFGITTEDVPPNGTGHVQLYKNDKMTKDGMPVVVDNTGGWWATDFPSGTNVIVAKMGCLFQIIAAAC